ncbi:hypothetical protein TTHERM_000458199 (macronuclear) [Tetrahymena thermophila SB210]|uniref:Uncharacterized protein n=1 Tax=Tetrahymena thermophila (strain SB210) TaxID=312017 RepID=W7X3F7_TETTS|nr:hypothetical protein TTHERM_000458199 [Tetrahymena thermophila SB210]EWS71992.1 hypothetical protein TTHERM_000458199 [Tetrahymena thermophila SB210]|eukprot:XP_012655492.1 hypothetical protein TTHERM_000458199 [Tetrahymena thermophila SB210]
MRSQKPTQKQNQLQNIARNAGIIMFDNMRVMNLKFLLKYVDLIGLVPLRVLNKVQISCGYTMSKNNKKQSFCTEINYQTAIPLGEVMEKITELAVVEPIAIYAADQVVYVKVSIVFQDTFVGRVSLEHQLLVKQ